MADRTEKRPALKYRPVFTQYVCHRKCRYNPSMSRFDSLDPSTQDALLKRMRERDQVLPLRILRRAG